MPPVSVCKPCRERRAQLTENHEEQIDYRHAFAFLGVQTIPSFLIGRLVARRYVLCRFHAEGIPYEREQVDHHKSHAQKTHHKAAQGNDEYAVGDGTHVAQNVHYGESYDACHLLATYAHHLIEERCECRHAY